MKLRYYVGSPLLRVGGSPFLIVINVKRLHRAEVPDHCTSEACVQAATELMRSVDHGVDPCQNFYRFACGKWGEQVQPTQDPSYHSWFHVITRGLKQSVSDVLEVPRGSPDPLAVVNMRKLYDSCMNTEALESRGLAPLRRFMRLMGLPEKTPTPDNAVEFRLGRTLGLLVRHLGLGPLFSFTVAVDLHDKVTSYSPTTIKIQLSPPRGSEVAGGLVSGAEVDAATLPLTADEKLKLKVSFISAVIRHYSGGNTTAENATVLATKILLFHRALQQAVRRSPLTGSSDREHRTFSDVQKTMNVSGSSKNMIDFEEFLEVVVQGLNVTVDFEQTDILVTRPTYLSSLAEMLGMFQAESIQRYIWWSVLESLLPYGDSTFVQMLQTYMQAQFDDDVKTRRTACSNHVAKLLPAAVVFAMAQRDPMRDALSRVKEMMEDIQSSFRALVESGEWLDERTKRATLEKADMVRLRIGYPSWNLDSQQLDEYHGQVELHPEEFLDNVLLVKANEQKRKLLELHKNDTDDDSEVDPSGNPSSPILWKRTRGAQLRGDWLRPGTRADPRL